MRNLDLICNYLQQTLQFNSRQLQLEMTKFGRHEDIADEFCRYIANGKYTDPEISIEGFTARSLCEKYPNDITCAYEAYALLILLRESPKATLRYIEAGFPIK